MTYKIVRLNLKKNPFSYSSIIQNFGHPNKWKQIKYHNISILIIYKSKSASPVYISMKKVLLLLCIRHLLN